MKPLLGTRVEPLMLTPTGMRECTEEKSICHVCFCRRYDDGCTGITNIDFSKGVIKEMMLKNLRKRPRMKWQVMDMTETKVRLLTHCNAPAPNTALLKK